MGHHYDYEMEMYVAADWKGSRFWYCKTWEDLQEIKAKYGDGT